MSGEEEVKELLQSLDVSGIDGVLKDVTIFSNRSFGDLVYQLIRGEQTMMETLGDYVWDILWQEWETNRKCLLYIMLLAIAFSLLKNFATVFEKSYISNVCFLLVYSFLMVLLMKSITILNGVVEQTISLVIDFMTAFIPVFTTTVVVSGGNATAIGFYQLGFFVVYVVQWVLCYGLIPVIRMYVVMGLLNYVVEEGRFSKMTDMLEHGISWALKLMTSVILGVNIIKNAIAPVTDTFARQTLRKSLAFVPGIGSTLTAVSDLFLAAGDVIRSGIGTSALVTLVVIVFIPLCKVGIMVILYRLLAVFVEPVGDRRMSNAIWIAAKGGSLLFRILTTCVILVFITVAMTTLIGGRS